MTILVVLLWGLAGWCGTRGPRPPINGPNPLRIVAGIVGGVAGGILAYFVLGISQVTAIDLLATSFAAYVGGFVVFDFLYTSMRDKMAG